MKMQPTITSVVHSLLGGNAFLALLCQLGLKMITEQIVGYTVQLLSFSVVLLCQQLIAVDTNPFKCRGLGFNNLFEGDTRVGPVLPQRFLVASPSGIRL